MAAASRSKKRSWWKRTFRWLALGFLGFLLLTASLVLLFRFVPVPVTGVMVERRIQSWFSEGSYTSSHDWVSLDEIAPCMGAAVIASEDQNFAEHFGFDWKAIEKAIAHNERSKRKRGASTVSQQTAKNVFLWDGRTWIRKGFEVYYTLLIETLWSKKRILEVYLNSVEFGDGIFGVEAAARTFFGKSAAKLRPSEAAVLAAVLPNPHKFKASAPSPYIRSRQAWILNQMRQLGGETVVKKLEE
jgi:monofunctional biosynthetic peptidoglycan transglycosylase